MAFNPSDDFLEAWTNRTVMQVRRRALAYGLGNNSSEPLVRSNYKYHVANPTLNATAAARNRNNTTGALSDVTAPTSDTASLAWIEVVATGNQHWQHRVDDRDLNYTERAGITLGALRSDTANKMRDWVDAHIWAQVASNVTSGNTQALTDTGGIDWDISTGALDGGTDAQKTAFWASLWNWLRDLTLELANANVDPATGDGDTADTLAVVMMPYMLHGLKQYMRDTSGITVDEIKLEGIDRTGIRSSARWRGQLFDTLDLYVDTGATFKPTAAGDDGKHILACIPNRSWDNAIMAYPLGYNAPDGTSRKHRFLQEVEAWVKIIESSYTWAASFDVQA